MASPGTSANVPAGSTQQVTWLAQLPTQLASAHEEQVLAVSAEALVKGLPGLGYMRIAFLSEGTQVKDVVEVCMDPSLAPDMEQAITNHLTAQHAAVHERKTISVPTNRCFQYEDSRLLHEVCNMQCFAAVPLLQATSTHGVMVVASQDPEYLTDRTMELLEATASMVAPYAAMRSVREQVAASKQVLRLMMPPRVVDAVTDRIGWGNEPLDLPR